MTKQPKQQTRKRIRWTIPSIVCAFRFRNILNCTFKLVWNIYFGGFVMRMLFWFVFKCSAASERNTVSQDKTLPMHYVFEWWENNSRIPENKFICCFSLTMLTDSVFWMRSFCRLFEYFQADARCDAVISYADNRQVGASRFSFSLTFLLLWLWMQISIRFISNWRNFGSLTTYVYCAVKNIVKQ